MNPDAEKVSYSLFSCIGTGFAAIALGAQLKRWYGIEDIQFFERHSSLGGTWFINKYPGCACDVPSALYSISFAPNPDWTKVMPSHSELWEYLDKVARDYDLIDVPGVETFRGEVVHTGKWRPIDLEGKKVIMFGNGCTASQVVPAIVHKTKSLTQVVRTKHWIMPSLDADVPPWVRLVLKWVPAVAWLQRLMIFCVAENSFRGFRMTDGGKKFRASQRKVSEDYMRAAAPAKYHDMLIPDFEVNCKRRIFDPGYLQSIHADNFDLTDEKVVEITPDGVRTANGFIEADVLIFATGYHTNQFAAGIDVRGRGGETLESRWEALGGEGAYNTTAMSGFPNFFFLLGPNSVTGHTSTVMALENCINYALRVIKPVLKGRSATAMIKSDAEQRYVDDIQDALQKTVWNTGCGAWYTKTSRDGTKRWNAMGYPYSQPHFWYRCLFPVWSDWQYSGRAAYASQIHTQGSGVWITAVLVAIVTLAVLGFLGRDWLRGIVPDLSAATRGSAAFVPNYL
uniref:Dimethylaniline monooxygenase n=1 Tax=Colletotrichum fructicola (strain Nara gc5) TaxID=1213859 RepID=L2GGI8_COLFN